MSATLFNKNGEGRDFDLSWLSWKTDVFETSHNWQAETPRQVENDEHPVCYLVWTRINYVSILNPKQFLNVIERPLSVPKFTEEEAVALGADLIHSEREREF